MCVLCVSVSQGVRVHVSISYMSACVYVRTYMGVLCVSLCKWLCACVSVHVVVTVVNCPSSNHAMLCDCL